MFAAGIALILNNVQYPDNSVVNITDIGNGSAALFCNTTYIPCCLSTDGSHWYFPDRSRVQRTESLPYYRTRTYPIWLGGIPASGGTVRLNRNPEATTTGIFHCDILDASGDLQSIYVGIYTATTGECLTMKRNKSSACKKNHMYNLNRKHLTGISPNHTPPVRLHTQYSQ